MECINGLLAWIECHPGLAGWIQAIGSIAAILFAVLIAWWQNATMQKRDKERDDLFVYNAVRAMGVEIASHVGGIERVTQSIRDAREHSLMNMFVETKVTFPVYENCAGTLGSVNDRAIQAAIIQHYRWLAVFYEFVNELGALSKKYGDKLSPQEIESVRGMQSAAIVQGEKIVNLDCKPILDDYLRTLRHDHID